MVDIFITLFLFVLRIITFVVGIISMHIYIYEWHKQKGGWLSLLIGVLMLWLTFKVL